MIPIRLVDGKRGRLAEVVEKALTISDGLVTIVAGEVAHLSSSRFGCPTCSTSLPELEPRLFSFNSPQGGLSKMRWPRQKEVSD